jgi:hypothetical protein
MSNANLLSRSESIAIVPRGQAVPRAIQNAVNCKWPPKENSVNMST